MALAENEGKALKTDYRERALSPERTIQSSKKESLVLIVSTRDL